MDSEVLLDHLSFADSGDEILIISVDIGDGRRGRIKVHEKDNTDQLAIEFCSKHRLGAKAKLLLANEIDKSYHLAKFQKKASRVPSRMSNHNGNSTSPTRSTCEFQETIEKSTNEATPVTKVSDREPNDFCIKSQENSRSKTFSEERVIMKKPLSACKASYDYQSTHKKSSSNNIEHNEPIISHFSPEIVRPNKIFSQSKKNSTVISRENQVREKSSIVRKEKQEKCIPKIISKLSEVTSSCRLKSQDRDAGLRKELFNKNPAWSIEANKNANSPSPVSNSPNEKTEKYLKKIKQKRYRELFDSLLPDIRGLITKETVSRTKLASPVAEIISPLLEELKEMDETLNFKEFYDALELLVKSLNPSQKHALLMTGKGKTSTPIELNLKPNAKNKQSIGKGAGLYERCLQKKQELWKRLKYEKEEKEKAEMKECVFRPNIASGHRKSMSSAGIACAKLKNQQVR